MEFLRIKCPDTLKSYITNEHQKHLWISTNLYNLMPTLVNFLSFPTTFCQLLLTNYHSSLNWSNLKSFLYATKKKNFLWSLKIIIWSSLLHFRLCLCVRTFYCIMEKVPLWNIFLIFFVTDHYIKL